MTTATRAQIIELLAEGLTNVAIAKQLGCDRYRVGDIRRDLGIPQAARPALTLEQKWRANTREVDGGHLEWTGERQATAGTPVLRHRGKSYSPAALAFKIRHGRDPQGYAYAECGHTRHCIEPDHVNDQAGRARTRAETATPPADPSPTPKPQPEPAAELTTTETRIHQLIRRGLNNKEITHQLGCSTRTLTRHITTLYRKLGVTTREQAMKHPGNLHHAPTLPTARVDADWHARAACRDADPELFFPTGNTGPALLQIEEAKAYCRGCPVLDACQAHALTTGEKWGLWGGLSAEERDRILGRKRRRRDPDEAAA